MTCERLQRPQRIKSWRHKSSDRPSARIPRASTNQRFQVNRHSLIPSRQDDAITGYFDAGTIRQIPGCVCARLFDRNLQHAYSQFIGASLAGGRSESSTEQGFDRDLIARCFAFRREKILRGDRKRARLFRKAFRRTYHCGIAMAGGPRGTPNWEQSFTGHVRHDQFVGSSFANLGSSLRQHLSASKVDDYHVTFTTESASVHQSKRRYGVH